MALGSEWLEIGASARNLVVVKEALLPILPEARKKGLRFVEDQSLGPTGLRAAWAGRHAEYSYDRLSRAVTDVIRNSITRKTIPEGDVMSKQESRDEDQDRKDGVARAVMDVPMRVEIVIGRARMPSRP